MSISRSGDSAPLAEQVREKREAAQRQARALVALATDLQQLIDRAQHIPGTYLVWARLTDAQSDVLALATEWEERAQ